jgi:hypothetical protein
VRQDVHRGVAPWPHARRPSPLPWERWGDGTGCVRESGAVYRPRHPERTTFYRTLDDDFGGFTLAHEGRYEREDGPLRPVVRSVVESFLDCGRPENGTRIGSHPVVGP